MGSRFLSPTRREIGTDRFRFLCRPLICVALDYESASTPRRRDMPAHPLNLPAATPRPMDTRLAAGLCAALLGPIPAVTDVLSVNPRWHPLPDRAGRESISLVMRRSPRVTDTGQRRRER